MTSTEPSVEGVQAVDQALSAAINQLWNLVETCDTYGLAHRNTDESIRLLVAAQERVQNKIYELEAAGDSGGESEGW